MDLKGIYTADANRYGDAEALYKKCGKSGVLLPKVSLGFWHNFGGVDPYERSRAITIMPSTTESPTLTLPTTMVLHTEAQKKPWAD